MELTKGDIINVNEKDYIVIENLDYNNEKFVFVNELQTNEQIGENYYILKIINDKAETIKDEKQINELLERFKELINKDLEDILKLNES